jgi:iron complex outermembrane recepter protein
MLFFATNTYGQTETKNTIIGKVWYKNEAVENAIVLLRRASDSSIIKNNITIKDGSFSLSSITNGMYFITIEKLNFKKFNSSSLVMDNKIIDLGNITLLLAATQQQMVQVVAKKPMVEVKADKIVVNVDANIANEGSNALEVLQRSPGVMVDKDGTVSLKGNASITIYIDGRPTYLSGADLSTMLSNMQSNQIETIELMTNPPAKYDAAGNGGIINIKTKKSKVFGFNGSVNVSAGVALSYPRFSESANLNYRKNKFNVFGSLSHSYRERYQKLTIDRKFIDASSGALASLFSQVNKPIRVARDYSSKFGIDYNVNKKTTVGVVIKGSYSPSDNDAIGDIILKNAFGIIDSTTKSASLSKSLWQNLSTNVNVRHIIDTTGKELNFNIDYIGYKATNDVSLTNAYYKLGIPTTIADTLLGGLPQNIKIYSAKLDYSMPINKSLTMETGVKTSFVNTNADARYDSVINGKKLPALSRTNFFNYKENITAAYINFNKTISAKLSAQIGLRFENTNMKGIELTTNKDFKRNFAQLFPTAYFQYSPTEKHSFVLDYGRRIKRPDYESLNPFVEYLDKYTFDEGNPYLQPQFSHNIELTHTYKQFLSTTLNYSTTNNIIQQVFITNANKTETAVKLDNIASSKSLGLSVNAGFPVNKWFTTNINIGTNYDNFEGLINNKLIKKSFARALISIDNQFKFKKGWGASFSGFYITGEMEGVLILNPLYSIDMGVSKSILKKKGTLKFGLSDILWSQKASGFTKYDNVDINFKQQQSSRIFNLSFTYRFNKGTLKAASQRKIGGADEEQKRVSNN